MIQRRGIEDLEERYKYLLGGRYMLKYPKKRKRTPLRKVTEDGLGYYIVNNLQLAGHKSEIYGTNYVFTLTDLGNMPKDKRKILLVGNI